MMSRNLKRLLALSDNDEGCDNCGKRSAPVEFCKCGEVSYCSKSCKRSHSVLHKVLCTHKRNDEPSGRNAKRGTTKSSEYISQEHVRDAAEAERKARELIAEEERERAAKSKGERKATKKVKDPELSGNSRVKDSMELHATRSRINERR
jgi:hypothetical protein